MATATLRVGVVIARRRLNNPWVDHAWLPVAVLPDAPELPPWTVLAETAAETRYYAGPFTLELFRSDTAQHRDNLASGRPNLWVALRPSERTPGIEVLAVTADPSEGELLTEAGNDIVEPVPMPDEIAAALDAFVAEHHVERAFFKRKRDRADPQALARKDRRGTPREEEEG